jgi:phytol kinase
MLLISYDMISFAHDTLDFFVTNFPSLKSLALGGPVGLLWAAACLMLAGWLKTRRGWLTGYTRKLFHFLIFASVVVVHAIWKTPGVCLFGAMTTIVIAYALFRGPDHFMYEAMAREKDEPRRTHYIVVAYFATLIGGLLSSIFFIDTAVLGYLVCGLGDAIAEPVGTRFGKHQYRVFAIRSVRAVRSLEGSGSVFLVSMLTLILCMAFSPHFTLTANSVLIALLIAGISTAVEAVSPHGWDNVTLQVVPAWLGALLL